MNKEFNEDLQETNEQHHIHSIILEESCEIAEKLTKLECMVMGIECYNIIMEGDTEISTYTEEAQDIFNIYYDEQYDELYRLLYNQLKLLDY